MQGDDHKGKGKVTQEDDFKVNNPGRSSRRSPKDNNRDTLGNQTGGEGGKATNEQEEHDEEMGRPMPNAASATMYWDAFIRLVQHLQGMEYGSINDWYKVATQKLDEHAANL